MAYLSQAGVLNRVTDLYQPFWSAVAADQSVLGRWTTSYQIYYSFSDKSGRDFVIFCYDLYLKELWLLEQHSSPNVLSFTSPFTNETLNTMHAHINVEQNIRQVQHKTSNTKITDQDLISFSTSVSDMKSS